MKAIPRQPVEYRGQLVLVLGATGFIGRWVAARLSQAGARVFLGVRDGVTARALGPVYGIDGTIVQMDAADRTSVRELLGALRPAYVFNLMGYGVDPAERCAEVAYQINARLVECVAEAAGTAAAGGGTPWKTIHVGSALEYGAVRGNLDETCVPRPTTLYGRSKLAGTLGLSRVCRSQGVPGVTARLFTVYGPGEHDGRLLPSLVRAARTSAPLELTAGEQRRDFTYVEDVADGLLWLGLAPTEPGGVVNLATGRLSRVRDFVEAATSVLQISPDRLVFGALPTRPEEMEHEPVKVERLRRLTGRVPATDLAAGIRRTAVFEACSDEAAALASSR